MNPDSSSSIPLPMPLRDQQPTPDEFRKDVIEGLSSQPKTLACKYFYDQQGSRLFDQICELDEYYLTRTEVSIMKRFGSEISERLGPRVSLIELGSGSSSKTEELLRDLVEPASYVPIDISRDHLLEAARRITRKFPELKVQPICADMHAEIALPESLGDSTRRVIFFPGSTIGNFVPEDQLTFLSHMTSLCTRTGDRLLIGIDLVKDVKILEAAYNDKEGVTANFNLNLLRRANSELGANFNLEQFAHRATFEPATSRIEMHLISKRKQRVQVGEATIELSADETICTEYSHKFTVHGFVELAGRAGWKHETTWTDDNELFAVMLFDFAANPS